MRFHPAPSRGVTAPSTALTRGDVATPARARSELGALVGEPDVWEKLPHLQWHRTVPEDYAHDAHG